MDAGRRRQLQSFPVFSRGKPLINGIIAESISVQGASPVCTQKEANEGGEKQKLAVSACFSDSIASKGSLSGLQRLFRKVSNESVGR